MKSKEKILSEMINSHYLVYMDDRLTIDEIHNVMEIYALESQDYLISSLHLNLSISDEIWAENYNRIQRELSILTTTS